MLVLLLVQLLALTHALQVHFNWFLGVDGYKVGHPPLGPQKYTQAEYLTIAKAQLREIVAMFGDEGPVEVLLLLLLLLLLVLLLLLLLLMLLLLLLLLLVLVFEYILATQL